MKIKFKNGEMIITHPSGHVDRYQQSDLDMQKAMVQDQIDELKSAQDVLTNYISEIQNSSGA